jgi:hypothetical protein
MAAGVALKSRFDLPCGKGEFFFERFNPFGKEEWEICERWRGAPPLAKNRLTNLFRGALSNPAM